MVHIRLCKGKVYDLPPTFHHRSHHSSSDDDGLVAVVVAVSCQLLCIVSYTTAGLMQIGNFEKQSIVPYTYTRWHYLYDCEFVIMIRLQCDITVIDQLIHNMCTLLLSSKSFYELKYKVHCSIMQWMSRKCIARLVVRLFGQRWMICLQWSSLVKILEVKWWLLLESYLLKVIMNSFTELCWILSYVLYQWYCPTSFYCWSTQLPAGFPWLAQLCL